MTKFKLWAICFACFTLPALAQTANTSHGLIPAPQKITYTTQQFVLDSQTSIEYGTPENLPTISAHPHIKNLYLNTGHFRYGLTMAPASAKLISDLIDGNKPFIDADPYNL